MVSRRSALLPPKPRVGPFREYCAAYAMNAGDTKRESRQHGATPAGTGWDPSTHERFVSYYAQQSVSPTAHERFQGIRRSVLRVLQSARTELDHLDVADIGCGAGTLSALWAEAGHRVYSLDVSSELVALGHRRAKDGDVPIAFCIGTATALPWRDGSMDVCLIPELLEHIRDWERCLDECARVLKPAGVLFLSTNNKLCPRQQEFNLPLYSWYPGFLKRRYERLAMTSRPDLANYATYPAVNWFTFYGLRAALRARGLESLDRYDVAAMSATGRLRRRLLAAIRLLPPLRALAHVFTPYTVVVAVKEGRDRAAGNRRRSAVLDTDGEGDVDR